MTGMWRVILVALGVGGLLAPAGAEEEMSLMPRAAMEAAPARSLPSLVQTDPALLAGLRAAAAAGGVGRPLVGRPGPATGEAQDPGDRRVRVGHAVEVNASVRFDQLNPGDLGPQPRVLQHGAITGTSRGFVWTAVAESPGAVAMRLHFTAFFLPRNAELYLFNDAGEVFGPYRGRGPFGDGEFWSHTLRGSKVSLQLRYDGLDVAGVLRGTHFVVSDLGHLDSRFPASDPQASNLCSFNAACVVNASCQSPPSAVKAAQDAVAMIEFVDGAWLYVCSGGLVADTDPGSTVPYFLTANHCVKRDRVAKTVEAFFQFSKPCGSGGCGLTGTEPRMLGATLRRTNRTGDYSLLELKGPLPGGLELLGWSAGPVANTGGYPLYRFSHPSAAPQGYSEHVVDATSFTCSSWPRGSWIYSRDTLGATEPGSSGSPVVDAEGRIVGQLSGGCGYNVNDVCDAIDNRTVDGAFASYFSEVADLLNPAVSCVDADGDGYCSSVDCNDGDPAINPGASEVCSDGVDNDCNGLTDGADPACQTGTCDLLPAGAACSDKSECCSGSCGGRPGSRTCR